jgi:agmatinase
MSLDAERYWRFMGAKDEYEDAKIVIAGAPMDYTVTVKAGTRHGPREIRHTSWWMEDYSPRLDRGLEEINFYDAGDLNLPFGNVLESLKMMKETAGKIIDDGKLPLFLGGEHLITLPLVEAAAKRYPGLAVIQLDAHADLQADYLGEQFSHATVMRRVSEIVGKGNLYQVGIRSCIREEIEYGRDNTHIYLDEVLAPMKEILPSLKGRPVYITLDIDVVDPAFAPGTGAPEVCGCSSAELLESLYLTGDLNIVGFDLNEVNPVYDVSGRTALLAAKVIREMLLLWDKTNFNR